ncbi:uncharacterized protein LOC135378792 isoform X2 [Ornithodoros turicata]|uniref:uncharacterized protein LOC135378792 isoform X2 n=1 Tax=Ornithodoros turicata TaxID=34597 RepID=UPI00313936E3
MPNSQPEDKVPKMTAVSGPGDAKKPTTSAPAASVATSDKKMTAVSGPGDAKQPTTSSPAEPVATSDTKMTTVSRPGDARQPTTSSPAEPVATLDTKMTTVSRPGDAKQPTTSSPAQPVATSEPTTPAPEVPIATSDSNATNGSDSTTPLRSPDPESSETGDPSRSPGPEAPQVVNPSNDAGPPAEVVAPVIAPEPPTLMKNRVVVYGTVFLAIMFTAIVARSMMVLGKVDVSTNPVSTRKHVPAKTTAAPPTTTSTSTTTTSTKPPMTDEELTKIAERRPITVLFVGDREYSTISKEQFMIYAQSHLNLMNAAFATVDVRLKMKVYDTYVMTDKQHTTYLVETPIKNIPLIHAEKTLDSLSTTFEQFPGGNESDIVFVFTSKGLTYDGKSTNYKGITKLRVGVCAGRDKVALFYDTPFSYIAILTMWDIIRARIPKADGCNWSQLDKCVPQILPTYKDDLKAKRCHMSNDTMIAPRFSGVVGYDLKNLCKDILLPFGATPSGEVKTNLTCLSGCGVPWNLQLWFLAPCLPTQTVASGKACFDDDVMMCFDGTCGKKYSEIKALSRSNWHQPDTYYNEDQACAKYP